MSAFRVLKGGTSMFSNRLRSHAYVFSSSLFFSLHFGKPWLEASVSAREWIITSAGTGELAAFLAY